MIEPAHKTFGLPQDGTRLTIRHIDALLGSLAPCLFVLILNFFLSGVVPVPGWSEVTFGLAVDTVYFWSIFKRHGMDTSVVFLFGIIIDFLSFGPPGMMLLSVLIVHGVGSTWRYGLVRLALIPRWAIIGILVSILTFVEWVVACISSQSILTLRPVVFQSVIAVGIYPSLEAFSEKMCRVFARLNQMMSS